MSVTIDFKNLKLKMDPTMYTKLVMVVASTIYIKVLKCGKRNEIRKRGIKNQESVVCFSVIKQRNKSASESSKVINTYYTQITLQV